MTTEKTNNTNLIKALTQFRNSLKQPKKDADNPFFKSKYVPLESVIETVDNAMKGTGLSYLQNITTDEIGRVGVQTILLHESGESIQSDYLYMKPEKPNAQGTGSAITYARRYALSTFLGIASETDDDGNEATGNRNGKIAKVDKEMEGKQQFLADKSQEFSKKYKINKTTFYASLGQTMGVQDPIDEPLAALVEGAKKLQVKYEEEKK